MAKDGERHLQAVQENWAAVADAVNTRMALRRVTQHELAFASGISVATLRVIQRGEGERRMQTSTLAAVARGLGWPDDHLVRILLGDQYPEGDGGEPAERVPPQRPASAGVSLVKTRSDIDRQILRALLRIERSVGEIADCLARV